MANVFTPGLKVTAEAVVEKVRRLPLQGEVKVAAGQRVHAADVVARADLPGAVYPVNVAGNLGCDPGDVPDLMVKREGDSVGKDEVLARTRGLFGFFKAECKSPIAGTVESVSRVTGQVMMREHPVPVTVRAYIDGVVVEVMPGEGVVLRARAALVQGIFGLGGERLGALRVLAGGPAEEIGADRITAEHRGAVLVTGALLALPAYRKAMEVGVAAVVTGGFNYQDIREVLQRDLGVAITGTEPVATTLVVTEGFGRIEMARATWELLASLDGRTASCTGATQIRAGVIRPEVVVPLDGGDVPSGAVDKEPRGIEIGDTVRGIRHPHFGRIGRVTALPVELARMESETLVRVLHVEFEGGTHAVLPRANVERIEA